MRRSGRGENGENYRDGEGKIRHMWCKCGRQKQCGGSFTEKDRENKGAGDKGTGDRGTGDRRREGKHRGRAGGEQYESGI